MEKRIFISYRRADSQDVSRAIYERLAQRFGASNIFMDIDSLQPGENFTDVLANALDVCHIVLVIIGKQWANITDAQGQQRLADPNDFTRLEVEAALQRRVLLIPVLVHEASMPRRDQIPARLEPLLYHQTVTVHFDDSFRADMDRLIKVIQSYRLRRPDYFGLIVAGSLDSFGFITGMALIYQATVIGSDTEKGGLFDFSGVLVFGVCLIVFLFLTVQALNEAVRLKALDWCFLLASPFIFIPLLLIYSVWQKSLLLCLACVVVFLSMPLLFGIFGPRQTFHELLRR